jgi:hypothetical protein
LHLGLPEDRIASRSAAIALVAVLLLGLFGGIFEMDEEAHAKA